MNNNLLIIGSVLVVLLGLAVMFLPNMLKPKVIVQHEREIVPLPYYVREHRPHHHRSHHPDPAPQPPRPRGDRSTPFCQHTKYGCYPGTQTPIP
jgi:hypothetical protein